MKSQNRRVVQGVMKSPSPDIAHRSIITNTKSPVNQIKQYIKMRQSSISPKNINKLKKYIEELEQKLSYLQKIHTSHDQLHLLNQNLKNQIIQLKIQLKQEKQRSNSNVARNFSPHYVKPISPKNGCKGVSLVRNSVLNTNPEIQNLPQPTQNDTILRQFNERIMKMSEENKRLTQKLNQLKNEKDFLEKQNHLLKCNGPSQPTSEFTCSTQAETLKNYFAKQAQRILIYYRGLNQDKIDKLKDRINSMEAEINKATKRQNQTRVYTPKNTHYQLKANPSTGINFRSEKQDDCLSSLPVNTFNMVESKYTTSPSQFKTFTLETSPIRFLEEEKDKAKRENEYLRRKADELQQQLKNALIKNHDLQKKNRKIQKQPEAKEVKHLQDSNFSLYKSVQQRSEYLEAQLAKKNAQINYNEQKINQLEQNLNKLKDLNNAMSKDYEKSLEQQKLKNLKLITDNKEFQHQIAVFKQNYLPKEQYFILERKINDLKNNYTAYHIDLERYLKMVSEIRSSISCQEVNQCLYQIQKRWEGYDQLKMEIMLICKCYEQLINNLKKKLLEKDQKIAQLQKDNQILFQSNTQIKIQLQKMQIAINQYRQPVRVLMDQQELRLRIQKHQQSIKSREPCHIRNYINRAVSKINNLQNEIDKVLNSRQSQIKVIQSIKYSQENVSQESIYKLQGSSTRHDFRLSNRENAHQGVKDEQTQMGYQ